LFCPDRRAEIPHVHRSSTTIPWRRANITFFAALALCAGAKRVSAQTPSTNLTDIDHTDRIRGVVINSVSREPISHAVVSSGDGAFATMTDDRGRFEFVFPEVAAPQAITSPVPAGENQVQAYVGPLPAGTNRPNSLLARKNGYLAMTQFQNIPANPAGVVLTIPLVPEARIVGHVLLPGSVSADKTQVQIYRRLVRERREQWQQAGTASTRASGEFRFADLSPGYYKLFTLEHMDDDPLTAGPLGPTIGSPPLYYPAAADFDSAETIHLEAGQIFQPSLSPVKKPYYPVKLGLQDPPANGPAEIKVWPQGHPGPGFSLGYDQQTGEIQGSLPDGTYSLLVNTYGPVALSGISNFTVRGAPFAGASISLVPAASVTVKLTEQFQHAQAAPPQIDPNNPEPLPNPRRPTYLQVLLEPDEPFGLAAPVAIRPPTGPDDESLVIENVLPGRYRVNTTASGPGYAAVVTSAGTDLLRQPLVVGSGASIPPIELTLRDDGAEIEGTVESSRNSAVPGQIAQTQETVLLIPKERECDPIRVLFINPDGAFAISQLPPGTYTVMALDHPFADTGYENEQFLKKYDSKIQVIHVEAEQKLHLRLELISLTE
jgi:hypothetical protein